MESGFLAYVAIGFAAQMVDGAIGMAHGVIAATLLLNLGLAPAAASAGVHAAKVATAGLSGYFHYLHRNVDGVLLLPLAAAGAGGGAVGAFVLSGLPGEAVRPLVAIYLALIGLSLLRRALLGPGPARPLRYPGALGLGGGFLDAVGGGGWGPLITATLIARGVAPRFAIGTANLAEFFVAAVIAAAFVVNIGIDFGDVVVGLIVGGALAAPLAPWLTKRLPPRLLMGIVGGVVLALSLTLLAAALRG
jgi:hypothetical protein